MTTFASNGENYCLFIYVTKKNDEVPYQYLPQEKLRRMDTSPCVCVFSFFAFFQEEATFVTFCCFHLYCQKADDKIFVCKLTKKIIQAMSYSEFEK